MSEWISCGLPFSYVPMPEEPDLSEKEREKWGYTTDEFVVANDKALREVNNVLINWSLKNQAIDEELAVQALLQEKNPVMLEHLDLYRQDQAMMEWRDSQPEIQIEYDSLFHTWEAMENETFCGKGLNKPGTEIEMDNGRRYLLGDINTLGGTCDDCMAFSGERVVARYRTLIPYGDK